jgi:hypothetical protein
MAAEGSKAPHTRSLPIQTRRKPKLSLVMFASQDYNKSGKSEFRVHVSFLSPCCRVRRRRCCRLRRACRRGRLCLRRFEIIEVCPDTGADDENYRDGPRPAGMVRGASHMARRDRTG